MANGHGVVRVGHDEYPGVELKVNMENILKLAGQKDEIFANFGTQIDMKGNKYAPHLRKSCIQAKASGKLGLSLFKLDF